MANTQLQFLLTAVYILVTQTTKGAFGAITKAPLNLVVYEGSTNTRITCESDDPVLDWSQSPFSYTDSYYYDDFTSNGQVKSSFSHTFAIDHPQGSQVYTVVVFNATIYPPEGSTFSTAGLYQCFNFDQTQSYASANLVVIRSDPVCSKSKSGDFMQLSCTIIYGVYIDDHRGPATHAVMTWSVNSQPIPADKVTFTESVSPTEITATSTILVKDNFDATYECETTFSPTPQIVTDVDNTDLDYSYTWNFSPITTSTTSSAPTTTTGLPPCNGLFNFVSNLLRASCYTDWIVCSLEINILGINLWPNCRSHCNNNGGTCIPSTSVGCPCIHPGNKKCQCS